MKNTYHLLFENVTLNKKQKWFDDWIYHVETIENHSFSVIHMLPQTRN